MNFKYTIDNDYIRLFQPLTTKDSLITLLEVIFDEVESKRIAHPSKVRDYIIVLPSGSVKDSIKFLENSNAFEAIEDRRVFKRLYERHFAGPNNIVLRVKL